MGHHSKKSRWVSTRVFQPERSQVRTHELVQGFQGHSFWRIYRELSVHFAAIRKNKAKEAANGSTPAESGKKPISFALYQKLLCEVGTFRDEALCFFSTVMILSW